jgi:hypothetical protein
MAQLPDTLDLVRQGPKQVENVRVYSGDPNTRGEESVTNDFLRQMQQFTQNVGGKLAERAAEKKKLQLAKEDNWARLKATNPVEWQKRLATGEVEENDHPGFVAAYNTYDAQARAQEAQAEFTSFDVTSADDETVAKFAADTEKKYLAQNNSVEYQGAISGHLSTLRADLMGRRTQAVAAQHKDMAYLNFGASVTGSIQDAAKQGRLAEIGPTLDAQIARGVSHGFKVTRLVADVQESLVNAVGEDPHIADSLVNIQLPVLGGTTIGALMGDKLMDVQSKAVRAAAVEERAARRDAIQQDKAAIKAIENQAVAESLSPGGLTPETGNKLMQASPAFIGKLANITEKAGDLVETTPGYKKVRSEVILGSVNQDHIDAMLATDQIGARQHSELTGLASAAEKRNDITKRPEHDVHRATVTRAFDTTLRAMIAKDPSDVTGMSGAPLSVAANFAVEEARVRVSDGFRATAAELLAAGAEPEQAFSAAAQDAREEAMLELDAISARHGLGTHAEDAVLEGSGATAHPTRPPVSPQLIREANDKLDTNGIFALDRMGGFHAAHPGDTFAKAGEALAALPVVTPWAQTAYNQFRTTNPDVDVSEEQYIVSLFYSAHPSLPAKKASAPATAAK